MIFGNGARVEKSTSKYGLLSNLLYHYKNLHKWEPKLFWIGLLLPIPTAIYSFLGNLLPSVVVDGLEAKWDIRYYFVTLLCLIGVMWLFSVLCAMAESYCYNGAMIYRQHYSKPYVQKKMRLDYDILEKKDFQTHANAAYTSIYQGRGINDAVYQLPQLLSCLLPAVVYAVMLIRVNVWIFVLAVACTLIQVKMLKVARVKHSEAYPILADLSKKMSYLSNQTMEPPAGKDIRLYNMSGWLTKRYKDTLDTMNRQYYKIHHWYFAGGLTNSALELIRNSLVYAYLIYMVTKGELSLAEFVLYFGIVSSFTDLTVRVLRGFLVFGIISNAFGSIREYFNTPENRNAGNRVDDDVLNNIKKSAVKLELRDVSYVYPGQDKPTIDHMNLTISPGEKLALIGLNGAGKTTLVKLICGFYAPTEGEILLNGIPVEQFERRQYYSLISVLFQDYTILPTTIKENVASCSAEDINQAQYDKCMEVSGFAERLSRLDKKGDSMLVREVHEDAVDFSGGEKQRLLLARALYKEAPLLILDEPTAALDPIAENEVYLKYGEATQGKTSIYISHRLSSTRFCDRIVLLSDGKLVEEGTHDELMAKQGKYMELFEMQSKYYKEQEKEKERNLIMEGEV